MRVNQLLIGVNVAIFAIMLAVAGGDELRGFSSHTLLLFGANYVPLVREGQWWRAFTSMFIHVEAAHVAMNMLALYQVGTLLEPHFGRLRYLMLYLAAGLGGSAATLGVHWLSPNVSAGASGAISGLIGAGIVVGHLIGTPQAIRFRDAMARWAGLTLVFGLVEGHIDNAAHIGGFVVGAGLAYLLDRGGAAARRRDQPAGMGIEAALLLVLVGGGFALAGRARDQAMSDAEVVNRGVELSRQGKYDEAMVLYRRAIRMNPNDAVAHFDLALSLLHKEDWRGAAEEAGIATRLEPNDKAPWDVLSAALEKLGRTEEAKQARARYVQLGGKPEPDDGD